MTKQEIARLVASLTDDELDQLRDCLSEQPDADSGTDTDVVDPRVETNRQFVKSLLGGGDD